MGAPSLEGAASDPPWQGRAAASRCESGVERAAAMIDYRPFRNTDPPALCEIWRNHPPVRALFQPLTPSVFENTVLSKPFFDREGLIVATDHHHPVGFVHAGFGADPSGSALDRSVGATCMLMVSHHEQRMHVAESLLERSEAYLRERGATTIFGGGSPRVAPFYAGLYGGCQCARDPGKRSSDDRSVPGYGLRRDGAALDSAAACGRLPPRYGPPANPVSTLLTSSSPRRIHHRARGGKPARKVKPTGTPMSARPRIGGEIVATAMYLGHGTPGEQLGRARPRPHATGSAVRPRARGAGDSSSLAKHFASSCSTASRWSRCTSARPTNRCGSCSASSAFKPSSRLSNCRKTPTQPPDGRSGDSARSVCRCSIKCCGACGSAALRTCESGGAVPVMRMRAR